MPGPAPLLLRVPKVLDTSTASRPPHGVGEYWNPRPLCEVRRFSAKNLPLKPRGLTQSKFIKGSESGMCVTVGVRLCSVKIQSHCLNGGCRGTVTPACVAWVTLKVVRASTSECIVGTLLVLRCHVTFTERLTPSPSI